MSVKVSIAVLPERRCWKGGEEPISRSAGTGRMSAGNWSTEKVGAVAEQAGAKRNTALYSMETSSGHGQERSRKQRGLWINKFCELSANASPKALETKHSPGNWGFFAQLLSFRPYHAIPFCVCVKHLSPTQLFCIAHYSYVSALQITQKELCPKFWNNCKTQTISCQNPSQRNSHQRALWSSFPSFSKAQSTFCFTSPTEYTKAGECNCSSFVDVVQGTSRPQHCPGWAQSRCSPIQPQHSGAVPDPPTWWWAPFPRARRGLIVSFWSAAWCWE